MLCVCVCCVCVCVSLRADPPLFQMEDGSQELPLHGAAASGRWGQAASTANNYSSRKLGQQQNHEPPHCKQPQVGSATTPHEPQLYGSVLRSTTTPRQQELPSVSGTTLPHVPQLLGSDDRSTGV